MLEKNTEVWGLKNSFIVNIPLTKHRSKRHYSSPKNLLNCSSCFTLSHSLRAAGGSRSMSPLAERITRAQHMACRESTLVPSSSIICCRAALTSGRFPMPSSHSAPDFNRLLIICVLSVLLVTHLITKGIPGLK
jgi:hypothetical protein